jgi:hypothetical protein
MKHLLPHSECDLSRSPGAHRRVTLHHHESCAILEHACTCPRGWPLTEVAFPAELLQLPHWLTWWLKPDPKKPKKLPCDAEGNPIDATKPGNWLGYDAAVLRAAHLERGGVGFAFLRAAGYTGIDLDNCRDPVTGEIEEWAWAIIQRLSSYTEVSISGSGVHVFTRAVLPGKDGYRKDWVGDDGQQRGIEMYSGGRYFTMSGTVLGGRDSIEDRQPELDALVAETFAPKAPAVEPPTLAEWNANLSDDETEALILTREPGQYHKLFIAGARKGEDDSKLDFNLACLVGRHVGDNPDRIKRIMERSVLQRPKWERTDYINGTITAALAEVAKQQAQTRRPLRFRSAADIEPQRIDWLWQPYLPLGELTLLDGDPGVGKSTLTVAIAAALVRGDALPGAERPAVFASDATVLITSAEDDAEKIIRPRLDVLRLTQEQLARIRIEEQPFNLEEPGHRLELEAAIRDHRAAFLIVDPLVAYLGETDTNTDARVRVVLGPLSKIAQATGCTVLGLRHLTKTSRDRALYRGGGSIGFAAAARSVLLAGRDPDREHGYALTHLKTNYGRFGPTLGYEVTAVKVPTLGKDQERGRITWTGERTDLSANRMLAPEDEQEPAGETQRAQAFLERTLANGPVLVKTVKEGAEAENINPRTLRRAKDGLGVESVQHRDAKGRTSSWAWRLPGDEDDADEDEVPPI